MKITEYAGLFLLCLTGALFGAPFVDNLDNTNNLNAFNGLDLNDNGGSGIVSMTRTGVGDEGADWNIGQSTNLSLEAADQQFILNVNPVAQIGNGDWQVDILFFDGGVFISGSETNLFGFTNSTSPTSNNIADFATINGFTDADAYLVRLRFQGDIGSGFSFTEIAAVPEPGHFALLVGGASLALFAYRRKRVK